MAQQTLLGIYPKKTITQLGTCTSVFIAALFTIARTWKQPRYPMSIDVLMDKDDVVYAMQYYSNFF